MLTRIVPPMAAALALASGAALAQAPHDEYPTRPVRLIVPFSAGGGVDILARMVGARLADALGQSFVIDNRTGAGGTIGVTLAAKAASDGHTLVLTSNSLVFNHTLYPALAYDTQKDLRAISLVATSPNVLVVNPGNPAGSVGEFIALARSRAGSLHYGSGGVGGSSQICAEHFLQKAGIQATHVPYKGAPPALADVMAGNIDFSMAPMAPVPGLIKAGRLKALGVTSPKRSANLPDVPTIAESGVPGFEYATWYGLFAPADVPRPVIARLNAEVRKALASPEVAARMRSQGIEPTANSPDEFQALVRAEIAKWAPIIRAMGGRR